MGAGGFAGAGHQLLGNVTARFADIFEERHGEADLWNGIQSVDQHVGLAHTDEVAHLLTILENEEIGNRVDAELDGEIAIFIDIDFANFDRGQFFGDLIQDGNLHATGAAPRRPKVNQHEAGGDEILECLLVEFRAHRNLLNERV